MAIISQVISDEPIPDVKRLNPDVPNWAAALVFRMCAKDPAKRIASADNLLSTIDVYLRKEREEVDYSPVPEKPAFDFSALGAIGEQGKGDSRSSARQIPMSVKVAVAVVAAMLLVALLAFI